ncbi:uncharacterized protein [Spinacia oleracea]|uniref:Uncharacterized protein isoform X2 n=1 Tax=Spinacia oleracea TaxID=3562 RepID=A0ABM3RKE0_SPIOL|nr:uncharacterized protein LOC110781477 isoform X2 [Spinacia oleracea]
MRLMVEQSTTTNHLLLEEQSNTTNRRLSEGSNMDEIQQEEDEYEPNHDQLQFENEERVERQGGENMTPNKCRSPMSVIKEWVPVCEDDLNPKEGMEFDNLEECEKFYKKYAHQVGFSVRKSSSKKDKKKLAS